jgi:hypothetical protein
MLLHDIREAMAYVESNAMENEVSKVCGVGFQSE